MKKLVMSVGTESESEEGFAGIFGNADDQVM